MSTTPENTPEFLKPEQSEGAPEVQSKAVDVEQLATEILTGCATGADVSSHFAALADADERQKIELRSRIASKILENPSLLTAPHHWMTLSMGAGRNEYIKILRVAFEQSSGLPKLTIGTKCADVLRRETDPNLKSKSLATAGAILAIGMGEVALKREEDETAERARMREMGSAFYTRSFIVFEQAEHTQKDDMRKNRLLNDSLGSLERSRQCAERGGDKEGAAQAEIRSCAVLLDTERGDPAELVGKLDALAQRLAAAESTWGKRFLNNALGRRVEAAAKCNHAEWERFYRELMARNPAQQYGGEEKFKAWKQVNCPQSMRQEKELE